MMLKVMQVFESTQQIEEKNDEMDFIAHENNVFSFFKIPTEQPNFLKDANHFIISSYLARAILRTS